MPSKLDNSLVLPPIEPKATGIVPETKAPIVVYHYTNARGFKGIIENDMIWLSNATYLNDSSEVDYGRRLVEQELDLHIEKFALSSTEKITDPTNSTTAGYPDAIKHQFLTTIKGNIIAKQLDPVYVTCFCSQDNLLSQWRAYGQEGGGFSIGFEINPEAMRSSNMHNYIKGHNVIYRPSDQLEYIRWGIQSLLAHLDLLAERVPPERILHRHDHWIQMLEYQSRLFFNPMLYAFKNSGFDIGRVDKLWAVWVGLFREATPD